MNKKGVVKRILEIITALCGIILLFSNKNGLEVSIKSSDGSSTNKVKFFEFLDFSKETEILKVSKILVIIAIVILFVCLLFAIRGFKNSYIQNERPNSMVSTLLLVSLILITVISFITDTKKTETLFETYNIKYKLSAFKSVWYYLMAVCTIESITA